MSKDNNIAYIYRYNKETTQWAFVPVSDVDMDGKRYIKVPIEKWALSTGKAATLYQFIHSKAEVESMMIWGRENGDIIPQAKIPILVLFSVEEEDGSLLCVISHAVRNTDPCVKLIASQDNMSTLSSDSMFIHPDSVLWDRLREMIASAANITIVNEKCQDCPSIYRSLTKMINTTMLAGLLDTLKGLPKEVNHVEPNPELEKLQLQLADVKKKMRREVGFLRALYSNDEERRSDMAKMPVFRATLEVEPDLYGFVQPLVQQEQQNATQHYAAQLLLFQYQQQQIGALQHLVRQREEEQRSVQNKRSFSQYSSSDKHYSSHRKNARIY